MTVSTSRARRRALALATAIAALTTLAACADDQPLTAPSTNPDALRATAEVALPAIDTNYVTIKVDRDSPVYTNDMGGVAIINGTLTCSRAGYEELALYVRVQQKQPARVLGDGTAEKKLTCSTTAEQPFGAVVPAVGGYFDVGRANVSVRILDAPAGVVANSVAQAVRLF
jgi:hypothetical protein